MHTNEVLAFFLWSFARDQEFLITGERKKENINSRDVPAPLKWQNQYFEPFFNINFSCALSFSLLSTHAVETTRKVLACFSFTLKITKKFHCYSLASVLCLECVYEYDALGKRFFFLFRLCDVTARRTVMY